MSNFLLIWMFRQAKGVEGCHASGWVSVATAWNELASSLRRVDKSPIPNYIYCFIFKTISFAGIKADFMRKWGLKKIASEILLETIASQSCAWIQFQSLQKRSRFQFIAFSLMNSSNHFVIKLFPLKLKYTRRSFFTPLTTSYCSKPSKMPLTCIVRKKAVPKVQQIHLFYKNFRNCFDILRECREFFSHLGNQSECELQIPTLCHQLALEVSGQGMNLQFNQYLLQETFGNGKFRARRKTMKERTPLSLWVLACSHSTREGRQVKLLLFEWELLNASLWIGRRRRK